MRKPDCVVDNYSARKDKYFALKGGIAEYKESLAHEGHQQIRGEHFKQEKLSEILARQNHSKETKSRSRNYLETRDKIEMDGVENYGKNTVIAARVNRVNGNVNCGALSGYNGNSNKYYDSDKEANEIEQLKLEILADFNGHSQPSCSNHVMNKANCLPDASQNAEFRFSNANSYSIINNENNYANHQKETATINKGNTFSVSNHVQAAPFFQFFSSSPADLTQKLDIATQTLPNQQFPAQVKPQQQLLQEKQQQIQKQSDLSSISPIRSAGSNSSSNYLAISKKLQSIVLNNNRNLMPSLLNSTPTFYHHQNRYPMSSKQRISLSKARNESATNDHKHILTNQRKSITVQTKEPSKTEEFSVPLHISLKVSQFRKSNSDKQEYGEQHKERKEQGSGSCEQKQKEPSLQRRQQQQGYKRLGFKQNQHNQQEEQQHQWQQNSKEQQLQSSQLLYSDKRIENKQIESKHNSSKSHSHRQDHHSSSSKKKLAFLKSTVKLFSSMNTNNDNHNHSSDCDDDDDDANAEYGYPHNNYQS